MLSIFSMINIIFFLKVFVTISIFFVWVIRYNNIVKEFKQYNLPEWLRDLTGIIKLSVVTILLTGSNELVILSSSIFTIMISAAVLTHIRVKNPFFKMIPSLSLLSFSLIILLTSI